MKRSILPIIFLFICAFILSGCEALIYRAKKPDQVLPQPVVKDQVGIEESRVWTPSNITIHTDVPKEEELHFADLQPNPKRSTVTIKKEMKANKWVLVSYSFDIRAGVERKKNQYINRILVAYEPILVERTVDPATQIITDHLRKAAICGNRIRDVTIITEPGYWTITRRYTDTQQIIERYRDYDFNYLAPAILAGVGIGYLVWHGGETVVTTVVAAKKGPIPCPPGAPVPRP